MSRRWRLVILVIALAIVGVLIAQKDRDGDKRSGDAGFTDLDTALKPLTAQGWKLAIAPKEPGPYRLLSEGALKGSDAGQQAHVRDKSGEVIEEMKLEPTPGTERVIV